ncbi:hypothetical protein BDZ90DRAFT_275279 [Jaminaea rosea]|uniref:Uncharacterized protein n=1 Tax=Jaminaea rosea TaxID=1569628 RepID=A0A316UP63_9BASI|nr:hypothetical protein BDZ90DRAFT_275279 [Jaminaea rosea]PWN26558.1 hypothetical protein BDZ90DRAFT_275279 [Jaminaea rosea]
MSTQLPKQGALKSDDRRRNDEEWLIRGANAWLLKQHKESNHPLPHIPATWNAALHQGYLFPADFWRFIAIACCRRRTPHNVQNFPTTGEFSPLGTELALSRLNTAFDTYAHLHPTAHLQNTFKEQAITLVKSVTAQDVSPTTQSTTSSNASPNEEAKSRKRAKISIPESSQVHGGAGPPTFYSPIDHPALINGSANGSGSGVASSSNGVQQGPATSLPLPPPPAPAADLLPQPRLALQTEAPKTITQAALITSTTSEFAGPAHSISNVRALMALANLTNRANSEPLTCVSPTVLVKKPVDPAVVHDGAISAANDAIAVSANGKATQDDPEVKSKEDESDAKARELAASAQSGCGVA